ncbi:MAG TPA: transposase [Phycisphaerae bacterium]|nr:transposase [Phycisphaerae bacterium]
MTEPQPARRCSTPPRSAGRRFGPAPTAQMRPKSFQSSLVLGLVLRRGSGRETFERARDQGELPSSIQAAYGKLRRLPPALSESFLAQATQRLRQLWPGGAAAELPACLAQFAIVVLDGKTIKGLHKRLKPLRGVAGGAVGGKALVGLELRTGLVLAMRTHLDGDADELALLPDLLAALRRGVSGKRLWMGDRAFSYVEYALQLGSASDDFLVRRRANVTFQPDPRRKPRTGRDVSGRRFREEWGWLSRRGQPQALGVRQITLTLSGSQTLRLITSLLDPQEYPAATLLALYRNRWQIERVFQEITQVFGLKRLIGSSPRASIFQFAFCLLLYNTLQVVRAYVAQGQRRSPQTLSGEKLFRDLCRELSAWTLLIGPALTVSRGPGPAARTGSNGARPTTPAHLRGVIRQTLRPAWSHYWLKSPPQTRAARPPPKGPGQHVSAQRIIDQYQRSTKREKR